MIDDLRKTGEPVIITKRGQVVAKLVPCGATPKLFGCMKGQVSVNTTGINRTGGQWNEERNL
jgi:antitoxin (DNA-binding transcriptional repressor) of toxin-antitoxin stability system